MNRDISEQRGKEKKKKENPERIIGFWGSDFKGGIGKNGNLYRREEKLEILMCCF